MSERSPEELSDGTPDRSPDRLHRRLGRRLRVDSYWTLVIGTVATLCLLVGGAGAVGVWAQLHNDWESFFLMEQLFASLTPIIVGVGVIALLASLGAALRTG